MYLTTQWRPQAVSLVPFSWLQATWGSPGNPPGFAAGEERHSRGIFSPAWALLGAYLNSSVLTTCQLGHAFGEQLI